MFYESLNITEMSLAPVKNILFDEIDSVIFFGHVCQCPYFSFVKVRLILKTNLSDFY